jgi:hypothetical protein
MLEAFEELIPPINEYTDALAKRLTVAEFTEVDRAFSSKTGEYFHF